MFLFDEPLSNLDAKLRVQMRVELKKLHLRLGTTAIYVTHDQVEAMTLGDRVVVMKDGLVQQVGEPLELYNQPANKFVAGFIGSPAMNFATVTMSNGAGGITAKNAGLEIQVPGNEAERLRPHVGRQVTLGIRPEDLHVSRDGDPPGLTFNSKVEVIEQLGSEILLDVRVGDCRWWLPWSPPPAPACRTRCASRSIPSGCTSSTAAPTWPSELRHLTEQGHLAAGRRPPKKNHWRQTCQWFFSPQSSVASCLPASVAT